MAAPVRSRRQMMLAAGALIALSVAPSRVRAQSLQDGLRGLLDRSGAGGGALPGAGSATGLDDSRIAAGLREALRIGADRVVDLIGVTDGFWSRPDIRIPLPDTLRTVQQALARIGLSGMTDDLELRLNRAAEAATPRARALFHDAVAAMTLDDARTILNGPDDAATRYFQGRMTDPLRGEMRPIVQDELAQAGAVQAYDGMMGRYKTLPFVPDAKADLTDHVLTRGLDAIFGYLAKEEAAIRQDPAKRTTDLLRSVFA